LRGQNAAVTNKQIGDVMGASKAINHRGASVASHRPRGFAIQTVSPLPIAFAKHMLAAKDVWGWGMRRVLMDYNHWAAFGMLGEILPWPDNRVTLATDKDRFGLPVAKVTFSLHENDEKLIEFGKNKVIEVMQAAGALEVVQDAKEEKNAAFHRRFFPSTPY